MEEHNKRETISAWKKVFRCLTFNDEQEFLCGLFKNNLNQFDEFLEYFPLSYFPYLYHNQIMDSRSQLFL